MIKTLDLNFSGTNRDVASQQRPDRFPSIEDYIQVTSTFEYTWATTRHTVIGGFKKSKDCYQFLSVHKHSNCNT